MPENPPTPRGSLTLFHVPVGGGGRVPLRVHWTLLLAIPYFALAFLPALRAQWSAPRGVAHVVAGLLAASLFVAVALGVVGVLAGAVLLTLIAVFVFVGATAESRAEYIEARLRAARVADLMDPFVATVPADASVEEAARRFVAAGRHRLLVTQRGD